jgi:predicted NBD/HSP70 family sugar kinase
VCVLLGTGVSAGIVIGGEVYRGADCFSGEFGHTCITIDGPLCACGNRGCVEAYTSGAALARMALERGLHRKAGALRSLVKGEASRITGELLFRAAKQGDRSAAKIFRDMGTYLGIAVSNLINLLNPESIILEGGVSRASEFFLPTLVETTQKRGWQGSRKSIRISTLENGPALGAAAIVLQEIFNRGQIVQRTPVQK